MIIEILTSIGVGMMLGEIVALLILLFGLHDW